jgi:hypothetical protein
LSARNPSPQRATYRNLREAISRRQMQTRVALVLEIGVAQLVRVVSNDALDQRQVVEEDGTAQTPRYVNPDMISEE